MGESPVGGVPGSTVANLVVARVRADGTISVRNNSGSVDVVVDVVGSFTSAPAPP